MTYWLIMKSDEGEQQRPFPLDKPRTVIGREPRCDVRIAIPIVDRKHCEIVLSDGKLQITDLGSERGTFRNGSKIDTAELKPNDELKVGPVTFEILKKEADLTP